jgi:hypothetical protein
MFPSYNAPDYNLHALTRRYVDEHGTLRDEYADCGLSADAVAELARHNFRQACEAVCAREKPTMLRRIGLALIALTALQIPLPFELSTSQFTWQIPALMTSGFMLLGVGGQLERTVHEPSLFHRQIAPTASASTKPPLALRLFKAVGNMIVDAAKVAVSGTVYDERRLNEAAPNPDAEGNYRTFSDARRVTDTTLDEARQLILAHAREQEQAERPRYVLGATPHHLWPQGALVNVPSD